MIHTTTDASGKLVTVTDSSSPSGAAGGDLAGDFPNPTIKGSVSFIGDPSIPAGHISIGNVTPTINGVTSAALLMPLADADNIVTLKRPNNTWGVGQPYGKGQFLAVLKNAVIATDIGIIDPTGATLDDYVIDRLARDGALGLTANYHLATGLRQAAAYASGYAAFIQPWIDTIHLTGQGVAGQTQKYLRWIDSAATEKFSVNPSGNGFFGGDTSARGIVIGDASIGSGYFAVAHSAQMTSTAYALRVGPNGDTAVNAATGQALTLKVNNATLVNVVSTGVAIAGALNHSGATLGFYNVAAVARQTILGSRTTGAALIDLLTKLALTGIIIDGTTP